MFSELIRSFKKSNKLRKLTKEYLKYSITEHTNAFEALSTERTKNRENVLNEIVNVAFTEPNNQPVINKFELNKTKLKEIVINLESLGGAQYAKGHYVAISSIFYPQTLEFVVYKKRKTDLENIRMMLRILDYFKNNETGNIVEIDY